MPESARTPLRFVYDDGGRLEAGFSGRADDCVCRSIAIVSRRPYREACEELKTLCRTSRRGGVRSSVRNGIYLATARPYLESLGYEWTPTPGARIQERDLPRGRLIVWLNSHVTAVVNHRTATFDPSMGGKRRVFGHYS
jgi:hypothetical protein